MHGFALHTVDFLPLYPGFDTLHEDGDEPHSLSVSC